MNSPIVCELQFFPTIWFFSQMAGNNLVVERWETYQKRSFRNKCLIAGSLGVQRLTVPLEKGKHESMPITGVCIAYDEPWQRWHLNAIRSAYGRAPFFEHYFPVVEGIYRHAGQLLYDFNWEILCTLCRIYSISLPNQTMDYHRQGNFSDARNQVHPSNYTEFIQPYYPQVFEDRLGFLPNLSILDLLFCQGPAGLMLLKKDT